MIFPFNPSAGSILMPVHVFGPGKEVILRFALDTGATSSGIKWHLAEMVSYDPAAVPDLVQTVTASGVVFAPRITFAKIEALGQERRNFPMLCHIWPTSARIDGILGLDFFQGHKLTIDFQIGLITLE
jgi:predicted aspartyl protease